MTPAFFASSGSADSRPARPLRVLVVDDEPDTVLSLVTLLQTEGYEAKGVTDGESALRELETFEADAVVVDIAMPKVSGWDVAREVRKMGRRRPVMIAISGTYIKKPDEMLARAAGFNYFLQKPCDPNFLFNILAAIIPSG